MAEAFLLYYLELTCGVLAASVRCNDVAVLDDSAAMDIAVSIPVNQWIYHGANHVTLRMWVPQGSAPGELGDARVTLRVLSLEKGAGPEQMEEVLRLQFPAAGEAPRLPAEVSQECELQAPFAQWGWLGAEVFSEQTVPRHEITAFAEQARHALADRNTDAAMALLAHKNTEMAAAFGIPVRKRIADSRAFMQQLFAAEGWAMEKPDYAGMQLRLHAGGRLLQVSNAEGQPLLETPLLEDNYSFSLPLWLAKIAGKWVLVR